MRYIASVSFGKDSLAMLLRLIETGKPLDEVIFYNTGMEFECIYHIRDKVIELLKQRNITYTELHPDEPFLYSMFERKIKYRNKDGYHYGFSWCGGRCRWHTHYKLQVIQRYKESIDDDITDYVGIAYDEPHRFEKSKHEGKTLPLVEWKMTEADCVPDVPRDFLNYASLIKLSKTGVWGKPSLGTKEKGEKIFKLLVDMSLDYIEKVFDVCTEEAW